MSHQLIKKPLALFILSTLFLTACDDSSQGNLSPTPSIPVQENSFNALVPKPNEAIIHIAFEDLINQSRTLGQDKPQLNLYLWNEGNCQAIDGEKFLSEKDYQIGNWGDTRLVADGTTNEGVYWIIPIKPEEAKNGCFNFIVRGFDDKGDLQKYPIADFKFDLAQFQGRKITLPFNETYISDSIEGLLNRASIVLGASAHWLESSTFVWKQTEQMKNLPVRLYYAKDKILLGQDKKFTANYIELAPGSLSSEVAERYPHLSGNEYSVLSLPSSVDQKTRQEILKGEMILVAVDEEGRSQGATQVQPSGVLDDIFAPSAVNLTYGAFEGDSGLEFRVWAPTARSVKLKLYDTDKKALSSHDMDYDSESGAWSIAGMNFAELDQKYYRYEIQVYHPQTRDIRTYEVTDPYSLSLSTNSEYSQIIDINNDVLKPAGWDSLTAPHAQVTPKDIAGIAIHEVHIRDLSIGDPYFNGNENRGKFLALTESDSEVVQHLKSLSNAGMTHVELLPIFDIATINEDGTKVADINMTFSELCQINTEVSQHAKFKSYCTSAETVESVLASLKPEDTKETPVIQELNQLIAKTDSYNWGYDPFHYTVPEGSYSTNPEGPTRILELRQMIQSIKQDIGMNIIMDVVYNHTNSAGPDSRSSVLDKIVPWYYQRLDPISGAVETGTCCSDTASENKMFAKMIEDSLVVWARDYKIDAFRFDLMGYHPKQQILDALNTVKENANEHVYFLGEGWDSGKGNRFEIASQLNLAGTGIGTFSDRLRDSVRGGGPFDSENALRANQGVGNGAIVMPNEMNVNGQNKDSVLNAYDLTRLGMAGNLLDFVLIDQTGKPVTGNEINYNGAPGGYAKDPTEVLNYVSKHDNQALWDMISYKAPKEADLATRTRMQAVSVATVLLAQGVAFDQQGSELLRSKSFERDSYDSGDWYNWVDYTYTTNRFDIGLPRMDKDGSNYPVIGIAKTVGKASEAVPDNIAQMKAFYEELLSLRRYNSPLMILGTGDEIKKRIDYLNVGPDQKIGLLIQTIDDGGMLDDWDVEKDGVVIIINASNEEQQIKDFEGQEIALSSIQNANSEDSLAFGTEIEAGVITIKPWSVAVINKAQTLDRTGLPVKAKLQ